VVNTTYGELRIGGQYWDAIVWATGAWNHYLYTGDKDFLVIAFEGVKNSLRYFEETELDTSDNLFRGPGWSDGVAAYPGKYGDAGGSSSILDWVTANPEGVVDRGYGIPMKALSTNCLYYNGYQVVQKMAKELNKPIEEWDKKAMALKKAINKHFWVEKKGFYRFLTGPYGSYDYQEALGHAYVLEFGIADSIKAMKVLNNQHTTPAGVPSVWPNVPRYNLDDNSFARHSGTVWPQIQGIWATAAKNKGRYNIFMHEFTTLGENAVRDMQFAEIYHPLSKERYGGLQEDNGQIVLWDATSRQTWAATAYLRMLFFGVIGIDVTTDGVRFSPFLPTGISELKIKEIKFRDMILNIELKGTGSSIQEVKINGEQKDQTFVPTNYTGSVSVEIILDK
jgi:glycogen debranching enzyme